MTGPEDHGSVGEGTAVLDIGGSVGAVVLYTPAGMLGDEIDIVSVEDPGRRTHSQVHLRSANGRPVWAAVYPALPAGAYRLAAQGAGRPDQVTVVGGEVTELDWRRSG